MEIDKYKRYWCNRCRMDLDYWWLSNRMFCPYCRKRLVFNINKPSKGGNK